jgi:N-acetylglutamate synthase
MESLSISAMEMSDYEPVMQLWSVTPGIGLSSADSRDKIALYLERNPGFSLVARQDGEIVAALLCGHDGRRGFIHHLAVREKHRKKGLGKEMVRRCLRKLRDAGLEKCHIFILADNADGYGFWSRLGWSLRDEVRVLSNDTAGGCC